VLLREMSRRNMSQPLIEYWRSVRRTEVSCKAIPYQYTYFAPLSREKVDSMHSPRALLPDLSSTSSLAVPAPGRAGTCAPDFQMRPFVRLAGRPRPGIVRTNQQAATEALQLGITSLSNVMLVPEVHNWWESRRVVLRSAETHPEGPRVRLG
jgi:hypothetical protein